jgi:hypothetical protein
MFGKEARRPGPIERGSIVYQTGARKKIFQFIPIYTTFSTPDPLTAASIAGRFRPAPVSPSAAEYLLEATLSSSLDSKT